MDTHVPQLRKAFAVFVLGFGLLFLNVAFPHGFVLVFGCICFTIGVLETAATYYMKVVEARNGQYMTQVHVIDALSKADPMVRSAIGAWFPQYNLLYTDRAILCWEKTDVPVEIFAEFMKTSNEQYTSAERDWKSRGATYHQYWISIYTKLVDIGFVLPDSSAGSHSQMWRANGYKHAWAAWMYHIPRLQELQEMEQE